MIALLQIEREACITLPRGLEIIPLCPDFLSEAKKQIAEFLSQQSNF